MVHLEIILSSQSLSSLVTVFSSLVIVLSLVAAASVSLNPKVRQELEEGGTAKTDKHWNTTTRITLNALEY